MSTVSAHPSCAPRTASVIDINRAKHAKKPRTWSPARRAAHEARVARHKAERPERVARLVTALAEAQRRRVLRELGLPLDLTAARAAAMLALERGATPVVVPKPPTIVRVDPEVGL